MIDCVVTHHLNGYASGVARFNELLAEHLGVPLLGLSDRGARRSAAPAAVVQGTRARRRRRDRAARAAGAARVAPQLYLHSWEGTPLEHELLAAAGRVWAGNLEVRAVVEPLHGDVRDAWTPGWSPTAA